MEVKHKSTSTQDAISIPVGLLSVFVFGKNSCMLVMVCQLPLTLPSGVWRVESEMFYGIVQALHEGGSEMIWLHLGSYSLYKLLQDVTSC